MLISLPEDFFELLQLFNYDNSITSVGILARLNNPNILSLTSFSLFHLNCCSHQCLVLVVVFTVFDVECQRNNVPKVFATKIVIVFKVVKESFFVSQEVVMNEMIVNPFFCFRCCWNHEKLFTKVFQPCIKIIQIVRFSSLLKCVIRSTIYQREYLFFIIRKRGFET